MGTAIRQGRGSTLSLGKESSGSWGTEVSRTVTAALVSCTLGTRVEILELPHLVGSDSTTRMRQEGVQVAENVDGETVVIAGYEGAMLGFLLQAALGSSSDAGSGPYTHTLTLSTGTPPSYSAEFVRGVENGAADLTEEFYGLMCTEWEFSVSAKEAARWRTQWVGKSSGARASAGTIPARDTLKPILYNHCGTLSFNSNSYKLRSLKIKGVNKLVTDLHELGSLQISEPSIGDFADITIEAEVVLRSNQLYTDYRAITSSDVAVSLTDGTNTLAWTLYNCKIFSYDDGIQDQGNVVAKVMWKVRGDASHPGGVSVVLTNSKATTALS